MPSIPVSDEDITKHFANVRQQVLLEAQKKPGLQLVIVDLFPLLDNGNLTNDQYDRPLSKDELTSLRKMCGDGWITWMIKCVKMHKQLGTFNYFYYFELTFNIELTN